MTEINILVVDDEPQIRRVMRSSLSTQGYVVTEAKTGEEALESIRRKRPDLVLLDVNMPGMGGIEACREIRRSSDAPIIMLTVRKAERDKVLALDAGADDYVVKPFGMEELLARIRASLRRYSPADKIPAFVSRDVTIDFESRRLTVRGGDIHLTPKEFDVENLRVVINQLRKKIESDPAQPKYILTEPWIGYRFQPPRDASSKAASRKN